MSSTSERSTTVSSRPGGARSRFWKTGLKLHALKILVSYRLIKPGSEWKLHREWYGKSAVGDLLGEEGEVVPYQNLYRCLDKLLGHKKELYVLARSSSREAKERGMRRRRLKALAPGLTVRSILEKFESIQMVDVYLPTTDGKELLLRRYTQPDKDQLLLLSRLDMTLPPQPKPQLLDKEPEMEKLQMHL